MLIIFTPFFHPHWILGLFAIVPIHVSFNKDILRGQHTHPWSWHLIPYPCDMETCKVTTNGWRAFSRDEDAWCKVLETLFDCDRSLVVLCNFYDGNIIDGVPTWATWLDPQNAHYDFSSVRIGAIRETLDVWPYCGHGQLPT